MNYFNLTNIPEELQKGAQIVASYLGRDVSSAPCINLNAVRSEQEFSVSLDHSNACITYSRPCEFFRGMGLIKEWISKKNSLASCEERPCFEHLTYMVDCSRNGVCNVDFIKNLLIRLSVMGYDRLMLYTEDTYEVEGYPYFGHFRGRYSKKELTELDAFAASVGIELVPCIQTLAHLNAIFRWPTFKNVHDTGDILLCNSDETYKLIDAMVRTYAETFHSRVINIGMDEAEMIGRGEYLKQFGYEERINIMQKHLEKVLQICEKYGYTCMMWSDMFFKMISGGEYYGKEFHITEEIKNKIPSNVELVYWDYYSDDPETYEQMMKYHKKLAGNVAFAGGAWKWNGYAPLMNYSMKVSSIALHKCREHGITNVIVTGWGDDGSEASHNCVLPVLSLFAEYCYTQTILLDSLEQRLAACTGASISDFLKLDLPNMTPDNPIPGKMSTSPAKYLLYQDVLMGIYDSHIDKDSYTEHYRYCTREFHELTEKGGDYAYMFHTMELLSKVLEYKTGLGIEAKAAYDAEDRSALFETAEKCIHTAELVEQFRLAVKDQWYRENKTFGFEVLDLRLGGLKERLRSAASRLLDYAEGRTASLEELEAPRLPLYTDSTGAPVSPVTDNFWRTMVTASVL